MITGKDFYDILGAFVPLYTTMVLGYASVRWWKIFTPQQCSGINTFVAVFAVPFLSFKLISSSNPYSMNWPFIAADSFQKLIIFASLFLWKNISKNGSLEWMITLFSLGCVPNTLVIGLPLLRSMYGDISSSLVIQIMVFQGVIWKTLLLFMFEYRAAKILITEKFPDSAGSISSFHVDSDVISLSGCEPLQANAEIGNNGKLHVVVRKSSVSSTLSSFRNPQVMRSMIFETPAPTNLNGVEVYSLQSSQELASRSSSINHTSSFQEKRNSFQARTSVEDHLHMFAWGSAAASSSARINEAEANSLRNANSFRVAPSADNKVITEPYMPCIQQEPPSSRALTSEAGKGLVEMKVEKDAVMPPASVMTKFVLIMVWRKLIRNSNTYSSLLGLAWSLVSFRWQIEMPELIRGCVLILSNTGLGMAVFSLGLFMALQPKIIACGKSMVLLCTLVRFLVAPLVTAATSIAVGLRGVLLQVAIVQAALPQAIVSFVFAKEYNVHSEILSTSVITGMVLAMPVAILYHVLLAL